MGGETRGGDGACLPITKRERKGKKLLRPGTKYQPDPAREGMKAKGLGGVDRKGREKSAGSRLKSTRAVAVGSQQTSDTAERDEKGRIKLVHSQGA